MSCVVQVINVASTATDDNLKILFGFLGPIKEIKIYFQESEKDDTKVAYVVYENEDDAEKVLHLQNTLFHDHAIIVSPLSMSFNNCIPSENFAKLVRAPEKTVTCIQPKVKNWPADVVSVVHGKPGEQVISTIEPNFSKQGLPQYPRLPFTTEAGKVDEIRRTVLITNLDPNVTGQQVLDFFQPVAEVKFIRMAGSDNDHSAYVEFAEQDAIIKAFGMMGSDLNGRPIMVQHSNVAIVKPASYLKVPEENNRDDANSEHSRSPSRTKKSRSRHGSRTKNRSRSRKKSRSRHRSRTPKSTRSKRRSISRSHRSKKRSHSRHKRDRKRSNSRSKQRKRSHSREKRKDRSRSRRRTKRESRSPHKPKESKSKVRDRSKDETKERRSKDERRRRREKSPKEESFKISPKESPKEPSTSSILNSPKSQQQSRSPHRSPSKELMNGEVDQENTNGTECQMEIDNASD